MTNSADFETAREAMNRQLDEQIAAKFQSPLAYYQYELNWVQLNSPEDKDRLDELAKIVAGLEAAPPTPEYQQARNTALTFFQHEQASWEASARNAIEKVRENGFTGQREFVADNFREARLRAIKVGQDRAARFANLIQMLNNSKG